MNKFHVSVLLVGEGLQVTAACLTCGSLYSTPDNLVTFMGLLKQHRCNGKLLAVSSSPLEIGDNA